MFARQFHKAKGEIEEAREGGKGGKKENMEKYSKGPQTFPQGQGKSAQIDPPPNDFSWLNT